MSEAKKPWYEIAMGMLEKEVGSLPDTETAIRREMLSDSDGFLRKFDRASALGSFLNEAIHDVPSEHQERMRCGLKSMVNRLGITLRRAHAHVRSRN